MKLWLLEILACPIDHHYPLELDIFEWEYIYGKNEDSEGQVEKKTSMRSGVETDRNMDKINEFIEKYRSGIIYEDENDSPLETNFNERGIVVFRDELHVKYASLSQYLKDLISKLDELYLPHLKKEKNPNSYGEEKGKWLIRDNSSWKGLEAFKIIIFEIKPNLSSLIENIIKIEDSNLVLEEKNSQLLDIHTQIKNELEFLNDIKYRLEVYSGVIRCTKCNRWFPIVESIPQMLPDNLRDEDNDALFKEKWKF